MVLWLYGAFWSYANDHWLLKNHASRNILLFFSLMNFVKFFLIYIFANELQYIYSEVVSCVEFVYFKMVVFILVVYFHFVFQSILVSNSLNISQVATAAVWSLFYFSSLFTLSITFFLCENTLLTCLILSIHIFKTSSYNMPSYFSASWTNHSFLYPNFVKSLTLKID